MEKTDNLAQPLVIAAFILAVGIYSASSNLKPRQGRYTFTHQKEHWIVVGDTVSGRSWSCVNKAMYMDEENELYFKDAPPGFEGCYEMFVPSKVQKLVGYEDERY